MASEYIPCEFCNQSIPSNMYYTHILFYCSPISDNFYTTNSLNPKWQNWATKYPKMAVLEKTECAICFENCKFVKTFPCLHEFCAACCDTWVKRQIENMMDVSCPKCKSSVKL